MSRNQLGQFALAVVALVAAFVATPARAQQAQDGLPFTIVGGFPGGYPDTTCGPTMDAASCALQGAAYMCIAAQGTGQWCGATVTSCATQGPTAYLCTLSNNATPEVLTPDPGYYVAPNPVVTADTGNPPNSNNTVSDPIRPANGNVSHHEMDITAPQSVAMGSFERFYNSADDHGTDLGIGWRHSFSRRIVLNPLKTPYQRYNSTDPRNSPLYGDASSACLNGWSQVSATSNQWSGTTSSYSNGVCSLSQGGSVVATIHVFNSVLLPLDIAGTVVGYTALRDDGQTVSFTLNGSTIVPPTGITLRLTKTGTTGYQLIDDDDNVELYDAAGTLVSVTSRSGIVETMAYDTSHRLSTVTDSLGHILTLGYNTQNQLTSVTDSSSHSVQYGYDAQNRLSTVTNLDTTSYSYVYENVSFPNLLTGKIDESANRFSTWGYDSLGRGNSSQWAGGANAMALVYNTNGTVTTTDAPGAVRTFTFNIIGDQNRVRAVSGSQCPTCDEGAGTTYDAAGFVSSRVDYVGNLTCYTHDAVRGLELVRVEGFAPGSVCPSNLATYTPVAGTRQRKITTTWKTNFRVPDTITETDRKTVYTYDASGNVLTKKVTDTSVTPNVSRTWTNTYFNFGQVHTEDGPRTDVVDTSTYAYYNCSIGNQCGQVNTVANAAGQNTTYNTYNASGLPLTITNSNGVVTTLTYDLRQRLTSRKVGTEMTTLDYYPTGLLKKVTLPDTSYVQDTYDLAHRLKNITDGLGNHVDFTLDAMGNRTAESAYDPTQVLSRTRSRVFNNLNRLYQDIGSAGTATVTTTFGYDSNGNQTTVNAPLARNTVNQYDELNRLKQITDPGSGVTQMGYDANNNLTSVTDPRTLATNYTYTGFGDLKTRASPDTGATTNTYDTGGNLKTSTDGRGAISTYTYDTLNRTKTVAFKLGTTTDQTITYTYDAGTNGVGRLTGASDGGHSMSWGYDAPGRVTSKSQTVGSVAKSLGYAYTNGRLTTLTTPSGQSVVYAYTNGQITSISVNGTTVLSNVVYESFGPVRGWTWGNGTTLSRLHNTDGNTSQINSKEVMSFGYDDAFRLNSYTNTTVPAASAIYTYDLLDRLFTAGGNAGNFGWTYDANGNRLTQTGSALTLTISPTSNQVTSTSGARTTSYSYDTAGNTLMYSTNTFLYKNSGRIKTVTVGSSTTTYLYNALGQRAKKSGGVAGTVLYMYDETGHLLGEYNGTGGLVQETVWLGDIPVATLRPGTPAAIFYVHTNQLGAPVAVSRPSDNQFRWQWHPDAFGVGAPNENPQSLGVFTYNLRFSGQYFDSETGLYYNYLRDYDSLTGRYVESDPIGLRAGVNTYSYAGNAPLTWADPRGLCKVDLLFKPIIVGPFFIGAFHAYIVTTEPDGKQTIFRGGTTGPTVDGLWGNVETYTGTYGPGSKDYSTDNRPNVRLLDDNNSCACENGIFAAALTAIKNAEVPYQPIPYDNSGNSNSVAGTLVRSAGFNVQYLPAPNVVGFARNIPRSRLQ